MTQLTEDAVLQHMAELKRSAAQAAQDTIDFANGGPGSIRAYKYRNSKVGKETLALLTLGEIEKRRGQLIKLERTLENIRRRKP